MTKNLSFAAYGINMSAIVMISSVICWTDREMTPTAPVKSIDPDGMIYRDASGFF